MTHAFPTYSLKAYEPHAGNLTEHKADPGTCQTGMVDNGIKHHSSPPTITHGNTTSWSNYSRLSIASSQGLGAIAQSNKSDGSIATNWGQSGSKHTEIFSMGGTSGRYLPTSNDYEIHSMGFEVYRKRTDSTSPDNNNAKQHCAFLKRWGIELIHRSSSTTRFWSSDVLATSGELTNNPVTESGGVYNYEFYNVRYGTLGNFFDKDYVIKAIWFNIASQDISKTGDATTQINIYNMRFYSDFRGGSSNRRMVQPAQRNLSDRNRNMFG